MINFSFDKDVLLVMQEGDTKEYPSEWIPLREFGKLDDYGNQTSFWVDYLSYRPWVPKSSLYFLAKIIQKKCSENKIDWIKTFCNVEFNEQVRNRKKTILDQNPVSNKYGRRSYAEILSARLTAIEDVKLTIPDSQIFSTVMQNANKFGVELTSIKIQRG